MAETTKKKTQTTKTTQKKQVTKNTATKAKTKETVKQIEKQNIYQKTTKTIEENYLIIIMSFLIFLVGIYYAIKTIKKNTILSILCITVSIISACIYGYVYLFLL